MFQHRNICKFTNSLNCKIICFFIYSMTIRYSIFLYLLKCQEESRHFGFQVAYVQIPLQKYPPNEQQPNPFLFFNLVCLLSHLPKKIKATIGTSTTWSKYGYHSSFLQLTTQKSFINYMCFINMPNICIHTRTQHIYISMPYIHMKNVEIVK